jgi:hypothetical protein
VFGVIALGYIFNFVIFSLPDGSPRQGVMAGSLLIALGAVWVWLAARPVVLSLDRARNTCRLVSPRRFFDSGSVEVFPLGDVRGVSVNEVTLPSHDGPDSMYYEVRLETKTGRSVGISLEGSRGSAERVARRVRAFLGGGVGERLTVRRIPRLMLAVGGAFAVCGALLMLSAAAG